MRHSANARIDPPAGMKQAGERLRLVLLALMLTMPATGCVTTNPVPQSALDRERHGSSHGADWWQCLGDAQLSALAKRGLATAAAPRSPTAAQTSLSFEIAHRYIALRAQQTALVLLAARAELDSQLVAIARQRSAGLPQASTQLTATQAEQSQTRAQIAVLRERLAVLTGSAPGLLYSLPGGPVPLPPTPDATFASAYYDAARTVAIQAQSQAEHARAFAAQADMRAHTGKLPTNDALSADRQAIDALKTEEQARAAMTQAYVTLVGSSRLRGFTLTDQHLLCPNGSGAYPGHADSRKPAQSAPRGP